MLCKYALSVDHLTCLHGITFCDASLILGELKMVKNHKFVTAGIGLLLMVGALSAQAYEGEKLAKEAKITISEARAIALKTQAGKITEEELEKEDGSLRYSFEIEVGKASHEVSIDAQTGKVLENTVENESNEKDGNDSKKVKPS